jgi:hypothetical protein
MPRCPGNWEIMLSLIRCRDFVLVAILAAVLSPARNAPKVYESCDEKDGVKNGLIEDPGAAPSNLLAIY